MTNDVDEVQAALLYDATPQVDFQQFLTWFGELARNHELPGTFMPMPGPDGPNGLCFAGAGLHVRIAILNQPLSRDAFTLSLRAPILKQKKFDFAAVVEKHKAAIVITVADGEVPMPGDLHQTMAAQGAVDPVDPLLRLTVLHLALQGINTLTRAKMIDFCPSQSLLTVPELVSASHLALPVPLLFHPFPVRNAPGDDGSPRNGLAAIHAPKLIGSELELEAIPKVMPLRTRLDVLSLLMSQKLDGALALTHGEAVCMTVTEAGVQVDPAGEVTLWIRHEEGSREDGPDRVIASFDTPVAAPESAAPKDGHQAFQDRIARLKNRSAVSEFDMSTPQPTGPTLYSESEEDLRMRVQDAIGGTGSISQTEERRSGFGLPKVLAVAAAVGAYVFVAHGSEDLGAFVSSNGESVSLIAQILNAPEPISAEVADSGNDTSSRLRALTEGAFQ